MRLVPPFVLLDDARAGGTARLYRDPVRVVTASTPAAIGAALADIRRAQGAGLHAAGFLTYEAAAAFDPAIATPAGAAMPLAWFGLFADYLTIEDVAAWLPDAAGGWLGAPQPAIAQDVYVEQVGEVLALIRAGDLYQANLTFRAEVPCRGDPLALYAGLRRRALAGHGAVVATGRDTLLSLSPELFVALDGDRLTCRPMKGTARRDADPAADRALATALAADAKQRAENLMIVDLMRNDLSRVAVPGSVAVPALFAVETYPTVHQLTSTVTARLAPGRDAIDTVATLFPCGSITGAPKLRAIAAMAAIEQAPRGVYTGSIGRFDADGDATFNVAIRTLTIRDGEDRATMGLGSGIVADSQPAEEWAECLAKAAFVGDGVPAFDLIETMAFDPAAGIARLERHLARLTASAAAFGFAFDRHGARNELQAATFRLRRPARVRLVLAPGGTVAVAVGPAPVPPAAPLRVACVPLPVPARDIRLAHKTSDRGFYDAARRAAGTDEVLFVDADGFLTEGSFTSLFVSRGDTLVTPPLARGLLPGILRGELLDAGRAVEGDLTVADLAGGFFVGNALRGLMQAVCAV